jgi:hypothetical protein
MEGQIEKAELKVAELQQKLEEPEIAADLEKVHKVLRYATNGSRTCRSALPPLAGAGGKS